MFGLQTLDVILGLAFVYLVLSLGCSAIKEMISQWLNWRAETLRDGIRNMLSSAETRSENPEVAVKDATAAVDSAVAAFGNDQAYADYKAASTAWSTARADLAEKVLAEKRARAALLNAEGNVAAAARSSGAVQNITTLQSTAAQCKIDVDTALQATRAALQVVSDAEATREAKKHALDREKLRALEAAQSQLDKARGEVLTAQLYAHPIIRGLSQARLKAMSFNPGKQENRFRLPSYIPARAFSAALLDTIAPGAPSSSVTLAQLREKASQLPEQLKRPLLIFIENAGDDVDRLRAQFENWFEDAMERVSGLYKRKSQAVILGIAILVTMCANADTLRIGRALSNNSSLREAIVAQAQTLANQPNADIQALLDAGRVKASTAPDSAQPDTLTGEARLRAALTSDSIALFRYRQIRLATDSMQSLGLPLGWRGPCVDRTRATAVTGAQSDSASAARAATPRPAGERCFRIAYAGETWPDRFAGLFLTFLAVSLGAPFWFDVLNKIINIRSAGRAPEEKPKSPEVLPPATGAREVK
jgi:hypothetical protein